MFRDLDAGTYRAVYIVTGYTDLRFGIDGLAAVVQHKYELDPFDKDTLFLFCGRRADRIKGLLWEGDGFLLLYNRLENGRFRWPRNESEAKVLSQKQFAWLMDGLNIVQKNYVKEAKATASI